MQVIQIGRVDLFARRTDGGVGRAGSLVANSVGNASGRGFCEVECTMALCRRDGVNGHDDHEGMRR
jgi:hypothetical protein